MALGYSRLNWTKLVLYTAGSLVLTQGAAHAQFPPINGMRWRNIGPNRGGRSQTAAGSVKRPLEYYFGAAGGGLWKTTDSGTSWRPVTDGQITSSSVGAVAVSESNPDTVYIGTGETELRASVIQGDGIYKSIDAGNTWSHVGLTDTQAIARIRIHPLNPDLVYVAALGHPYGQNDQRGVFRSKDGGGTWERILYRNDRVGAIDLCLDANNPNVLFASLWEVYRKPWTLSSGGEGSGLFKSTDAGDHWTEITRNPGMPKSVIGKINVSVSGADSNRVYASIEAEDGGLFRSDDGGATWARVSEDRNIRQRAFYFNRIQADPQDRDAVYAMNVDFFRSSDGGRTLEQVRGPHADQHDLWIATDNHARMIVADDGGASVSVNGGRTWTLEQYPTGQFYHVATTPDVPYHICGAQQDTGTVCVPSESQDSLLPSGNRFYSVGSGEAGYVAPDPIRLSVFYSGDQAGVLTRHDRNTNQTRDVQVNPWMFSGMPARDLPERWQWVFPIVFSPVDPRSLYTSSQHLWKTTNEGQSWQRVSPDLTRADPSTLGDSGGPITHDQNGPEIYGTIFTVAPSRQEASTIWAGSDDGLVHVTRDSGQHWQDITPSELPKFSRISLIEASPNKPGTAYLAANRYEMDDRRPYVFRTDDYGKTWTKIVEGIASNDFARAIREDPKREGLLFLGTEHGVYCSLDNGAHWLPLALNLPDTQVPDLVVEGDDLVIATHGRSFYVLDDIAVLRQLIPASASSDVQLFRSGIATRSLRPAYIDYFLKQPANEVSISILDSAGHIVRSFSSAAGEKEPPHTATEVTFGTPSAPPPTGPTRKAGLNRFAWDLRYPGATVFAGLIMRGGDTSGPVAVPGNYSVQLTANGVTQTQPLVVAEDSRLTNVTDVDLKAQFALAVEVRDALSQANQMVIVIREIKRQIEDRVSNAGASSTSITPMAREVEAKLNEVESELYQVRNRSPRDTLNFPIKLNNQLAVLMQDIELGDVRPTDQMYMVFRELSGVLARLVARMDATERGGLERLNKLLKASRLEPISLKQAQ
jgi:photosystem II stability/assembly factor-like uncharacterized protein